MLRVKMLRWDVLCVAVLLRVGVSNASHLDRESRLGSRAATLPGSLHLPDLLKAASVRDPGSPGYFLTKRDLDPVLSVACLKAKQQDPSINCTNSLAGAFSGYSGWSGELNAGNFPSYKDAACHSKGALLCDPQQVLKEDEQAALAAELAKSRGASPVTCGHLLDATPEQLHVQPFYLGVVIIQNWKLSQSQPEYLQQLGQILTAQWDMNDVYVGSSTPYTRCPSTGILMILPDADQAYLSTPSCEFICQSRGGAEVVSAVLAALRDAGPSEAALVGVREVYKFLADTPEASAKRSGNISVVPTDTKELPSSWIIYMQRTVFVFTCLLAVGSFIVGGSLLWFRPGLAEHQRVKAGYDL